METTDTCCPFRLDETAADGTWVDRRLKRAGTATREIRRVGCKTAAF
jgi:hypothetical protein